MTKIIPEDKARQGRWGWHGFRILIAALLLAFIAWGAAKIYGEVIKSPTTQQNSIPQG
ncbi:hypothetical protein [Mesorhizobium shangrilense]|uniref:Uncharacterized protein n=1 Tax=Mesorhizobium shangrilense TaxID=460060 RepID=A0ABV2DNV5_9HYPH